tara:strand:+ start:739 stop:924 length:186 start_codon:yes stop_codon:yes gene_type:complete
MITIKKNPNFPKWFQVLVCGSLVDEVSGRANALRIATRHARRNEVRIIDFLGEMVDTKDKN